MLQRTTLSFLVDRDLILLGMKKKGFGAGKWNGFGGKIQPGEGVREAAVREFFEEAGVRVAPEHLDHVASLTFYFPDAHSISVETFFSNVWVGEPKESDEMRPKWFLQSQIPFESMWKDDPYWLPRTLGGEKIVGRVWFNTAGDVIERMEWEGKRTLNPLS